MLESRRRAYLEVMGYDIWSSKAAAPDLNRLLLQPGNGEMLLVCDNPDAADGMLAGDIVRALGGSVVWAWPDPQGRPDSPTLGEAVRQQRFTRVLLFGSALAGRMFEGDVPLVLGSARIVSIHSLEELALQGSARQSLWNQLVGKHRDPE